MDNTSNVTTNSFKLNFSNDLVRYLSSKNYSVEDLFIIYCIEHNRVDLLKGYTSNKNPDQKLAFFQRFERKLLIKRLCVLDEFDIDNYGLSEIGEQLLSDCVHNFTNLDSIVHKVVGEETPTEFETFLNKFLSLWPTKRNKAGEYLKSNKKDLENKLRIFFKKYEFTEEQVLSATKNYLEKQAIRGYEFCSAAHYFVSKDRVSKLAAECESHIAGGELDNNTFIEQLM